jgi:hypothetical protein
MCEQQDRTAPPPPCHGPTHPVKLLLFIACVPGQAYRVSEVVSAEELSVRAQILEGLSGYAHPRNPFVVRAGDFQAVLDGLGLRFGNDAVDRVMLLCNIDGAGMVRGGVVGGGPDGGGGAEPAVTI